MQDKNRLVLTVGYPSPADCLRVGRGFEGPVAVRWADLTEEALRIVLVNLLKPRTPSNRSISRGQTTVSVCSVSSIRAAGNANTVDCLKGSFSQYVSVYSDTGWENCSSSTYSLYVPVDRVTKHWRSETSPLLLIDSKRPSRSKQKRSKYGLKSPSRLLLRHSWTFLSFVWDRSWRWKAAWV